MTPEPGHGTGYEDAITKKIAAIEARAQAAEALLERERAQTQGLVADNAKLRAEAARLERLAKASGRGAVIAWTLCALAVLGAAALAALWTGAVLRVVTP